VENIISRLSNKNVDIKIVPEIFEILSGSVKTDNVLGAVLMDIDIAAMPEWQKKY